MIYTRRPVMDEQENQGNGGVYSKFQERLRNIRVHRSRKKGKNEQFVIDKVKEIKGKIQKDPSFVRVVRTPVGNDRDKKKDIELTPIDEKDTVSKVIVDIRRTAEDRNYRRPKGIGEPEVQVDKKQVSEKIGIKPRTIFKPKEVSLPKELKEETALDDLGKNQQEKAYLGKIEVKEENESTNGILRRPRRGYGYVRHEDTIRDRLTIQDSTSQKEILRELGSEIIEKIKSSFEDKLDELVVLEGELFLIDQERENAVELKKVKELQKRINELIDKVNEIIEQYNLYRRNYYIDNIVGIDDGVLMDDIIDYRTLLDSFDGERKFVKEYQMLDEFKSLYSNLVQVKKDTEDLVEKNEEKIDKFDVRDKKYDEIRLEMVQVDKVNKECSFEMDKQNEYFSQLMSKINDINREEYTTYHMRGLGQLITQSLRYMGLMLTTPFAGLIPGIAVSTLNARRMIGNIYHNMRVEEEHHVRYEAIDYDREISGKITDIDYTSNLIDDTLKDIERLKEDFMLQYDSRVPGYDDTLKKLNKMERVIFQNQNRVEIIRKNLRASKKINENKMVRVRRLNDS